MDSKRIAELLEKYWNCETSLEEEKELHSYFRQHNISDELKATAKLFHYFEASKKNTVVDDSFDHEVLAKVKASKSGKLRVLLTNSMRIAAGVIVLVLAVWFVRTEIRTSTPQEVVDTYDDPKLAFEETKKALLMISKSFGTAEEQAKKINLFNEAQEEIKKSEEKKNL